MNSCQFANPFIISQVCGISRNGFVKAIQGYPLPTNPVQLEDTYIFVHFLCVVCTCTSRICIKCFTLDPLGLPNMNQNSISVRGMGLAKRFGTRSCRWPFQGAWLDELERRRKKDKNSNYPKREANRMEKSEEICNRIAQLIVGTCRTYACPLCMCT